jgi:hypothetical protein
MPGCISLLVGRGVDVKTEKTMKSRIRKIQIAAARIIPRRLKESMLKKDVAKGDMNAARALRFAELVDKKGKGGLTISENAELKEALLWVDAIKKQEGLK